MELVLPGRSLEPLRCGENPRTQNWVVGAGAGAEGEAGKAKTHPGYKAVNGLFLYPWASELPCGPGDMDPLLTNDASSREA